MQCRHQRENNYGEIEYCTKEHGHYGRHALGLTDPPAQALRNDMKVSVTFPPGTDMEAITNWIKQAPQGGKVETS